MPRYSGGAKTTNAGSTTLPLIALHAAASVGGTVREIGLFNTTNTAADFKLVRLTTAGTPGSTITVDKQDPNAAAASMVLANSYSSTGPTVADLGYRASLGAAIGAGVIWTFGDRGLYVPTGTGNGVGIIVENGTGQIVQAYFVWDE